MKPLQTLLCLILLTPGCGPVIQAPDNQSVDENATAHAGLCATARENVIFVMRAYRDNDLEAMAGLLDSGKALQIKDGTKVHVETRGSGMAGVVVESGAYTGDHCWILDSLLSPDTH